MTQPSADRTEVQRVFVSLGESAQMVVLARLGSWLTVFARGAYDDRGGVADAQLLRRVNEAQHQIFGQLRGLTLGSSERYPDDVFANILLDHFQVLGIEPHVLMRQVNSAA